MISTDLHEAYFHIPVFEGLQQCLWFDLGDAHFQFRAISFGLGTAPRTFSKVLVTIIAEIHKMGIDIYHYDILVLAASQTATVHNKDTVVAVLQRYG